MAFEALKKFYADTVKMGSDELSKFKNSTFLEAVVAGSAKMAYSDGSCESAEKLKMMNFIKSYEPLQAFKFDDVVALWKKWEAKYEADKDFADMAALEAIGKMKSNEAAARMIVRLAILIANTDNNFEASEVKAAVEICNELKLAPSDFGLSA